MRVLLFNVLSLMLFGYQCNVCHTFSLLPKSSLSSIARQQQEKSMPSSFSTRRYNFFKDMIDEAFSNDSNLSTDKTQGQYDKPGEEFEDGTTTILTETQQQWRQKQLTNDVTEGMVESTSWTADLYLVGVPKKDPSNDLYASKVNISSRDKSTGLSLPTDVTASITIEFLANGICKASQSDFTTGNDGGEWKLSEDGKILRFSMDVAGYQRTIETKGTIQKIYWSDEDEATRETSSTYSIPPGMVYGDIKVNPGRLVGTFDVENDGVLRIEQKTGLLGIASKMVPCGAFQLRKNASD